MTGLHPRQLLAEVAAEKGRISDQLSAILGSLRDPGLLSCWEDQFRGQIVWTFLANPLRRGNWRLVAPIVHVLFGVSVVRKSGCN